MKISEVMTSKPSILSENATALDAAKLMRNVGCGFLPIGCDPKHITGVVTDRDILLGIFPKDERLSKMLITHIMRKNPIYCNEDEMLRCAIGKMNKHNIRRILVKNNERELCGVLSLGDIIRRVQDKNLLSVLLKETVVC